MEFEIEEVNTLIKELKDFKKQADVLIAQARAKNGQSADVQEGPNIEEIREILGGIIERQAKVENSFGVEKVSLKDIGDRVQVIIDTSFGSITTHAEKGQPGGTHSPVTYSGSTVAGAAGGPAPIGVAGGKGGGPHGMTPEQLQEFKKQSLQIGAAQQKLKELETKLNDATVGIKKGVEKTTDIEDKQLESIKELYTCIDNINSSLSEKIALQKVEVQKIAGDQPKPINYDPFNYGEAYAGDLVDFQARKRITELKLLMHGLQSALLQMRDSMKISPSIDLGYKVVRLDQLVGSTGFAQKVANGEVGPDDALLLEQSGERFPGKVEFPRKSMNQTTAEMESKWAITDSIMQTMYRLEMELGEIQKIVDSTGLSSGSKVIEDVQQSIRLLKDKQIDVRTVKRLIEDSKESSINLMGGRKSQNPQGQRATITHVQPDGSDTSIFPSRKIEQLLKNMQTQLNHLQSKVTSSTKADETVVPGSSAKQQSRGRTSCMSCGSNIKYNTSSQVHSDAPPPAVPIYSYFNPTGMKSRIQGPVYTQFTLHRSYNITTSGEYDEYNIPRPCGASYQEYWPLPKSFSVSKFSNLFEPPSLTADTKYIRGSNGQYYRGAPRHPANGASFKREVPITVTEVKQDYRGNAQDAKDQSQTASRQSPREVGKAVEYALTGLSDNVMNVVVETASDDGVNRDREEREIREDLERAKKLEKANRESLEKKYTVKLPSDDEEEEENQEEKEGEEKGKDVDEKEKEEQEQGGDDE